MEQPVTVYFFHFCIRFGIRFLQRRRLADDDQHTAAIRHQFTVPDRRSHVVHGRIQLIEPPDHSTFGAAGRIAVRCQHDAQCDLIAPLQGTRFLFHHLQDGCDQIALQTRQDDLCLRIAEARVELDRLDAVFRQHQPAVQETGKRYAFRHHRLGHRAHDPFHRLFDDRRRDAAHR